MTKGKRVFRDFILRNKQGLHARPASLFVQTANRFESAIVIHKGKEEIDGKSILGLLMLAAGPGTQLRVSAVGRDAMQALDTLEQLIQSKFGEE